MWPWQLNDTFLSSDTAPDRDGQTDGRTDIPMTAKTALCSASRGKNWCNLLITVVIKNVHTTQSRQHEANNLSR